MSKPQKQPSCQVFVSQIPPGVSAQELACFLQEEVGEVLRVKLKGNKWQGKWQSRGHAYVDFLTESTAKHACDRADYDTEPILLKGSKLKISMVNVHPSSTNVLEGLSAECGILSGRGSLSRMWKSEEESVTAQFDFQEKKFRLFFVMKPKNKLVRETVHSIADRNRYEYKLEFRLRDIRACWKDPALGARMSMRIFLELSSSPHIFIRSADDDIWTDILYEWTRDDDDPWTRTTDWTKKKKIGICNYYCLSVPMRFCSQVEPLLSRRFNQNNWRPSLHVEIVDDRRLPFWVEANAAFLTFSKESTLYHKIPLNLLFLLNSLFLKGTVPFTNVGEDLLNICEKGDKLAVEMALRRMFTYYFPAFEPARRLRFELNKLKQLNLTVGKTESISTKLPENHVRIKRVLITPTTAHALPPEVELSNRVVRHYESEVDRFLRVTFTDEGMQSLSSWALLDNSGGGRDKRNLVYDRIMSIVKDGFIMCGQRYAFLGCSNSQSREKSAWFFAEEFSNITVKSIRDWMGDFRDIKNVAKCQARMGQCFSSTFFRINVERTELKNIKEIENEKKYMFSDGIGKITPAFADELAKGLSPFLGSAKGGQRTPSAFQIRYAGYKGVLAVWPPWKTSPYKIFCRESMRKFQSAHCDLEVVGWSSFQPGFLNRQIITLLSTLGANDKAFMERQDKMIKRLDSVLVNREDALSVLETSCTGDLHSTAMTMLRAGFHPKKEPHLLNMLRAIRALQLHELIFKARIFIPKSRWMMGVIDETATLQYGECFARVSGPDDSGRWQEGKPRVITGPICFGKNPCHHPGDLRILQAVDRPQLHHLVDCIVLPVVGPRSHADEASGSDFDGDVYYVLWDEELLPPDKKSAEPMDYVPSQERIQSREITPVDLQEFFVRQMMNDSVGVICNAHLVHADRSEKGAYDPACLELAKQAALAFDFPKTGIPGIMPQNLRVEVFPDFMEKEGKKGKYVSTKVLGKLYRVVKGKVKEEQEKNPVGGPVIGNSEEEECFSSFPTIEEIGKTFDKDLIVPGYEDHLEVAMEVKRKYDEFVLFLMSQYGVTTEGELVTGHVIHLSRYFKKQERGAKEKIIFLFSAHRREFRNIFLHNCGLLKGDLKLEKNVSVEESSSFDDSKKNLEGQQVDDPKESNGQINNSKLTMGKTDDSTEEVNGPIDESKETNGHTPVKSSPILPILKPSPLMKIIASAWYYVTYNPEWLKKHQDDEEGERLLISFCWLVADVLCNIKSSKT